LPVGTANWQGANGPNTYVQGSPLGTDSVTFDDTAPGTTVVNLTTALTPEFITVDNTEKNYEWVGSGSLGGSAGIVKTGAGSLTLAHTGGSTNTGVAAVSGGALILGNGVAGAGSLGGAVNVTGSGIFRMNRPDGATVGALSGDGTLDLAAGQLTVAGGAFTGSITGAGSLLSTATLALTGTQPNTSTGSTTISAGQLQLNRPGVTAIAGDIIITGTGSVAIQAVDQIADIATITHLGTSVDCLPTQTGPEVVANVVVNSATSGAAGGQLILRNGFTVTGVATVASGILGVGSGQTGVVNAINITSAPGSAGIVRIAGNTAASTLDVGAGGITASGGEIQIKFNTANQDAVINLGGDFTATGNVIITNAGYAGSSLNVINLTGDRSFDIAAGAVTSMATDLGGPGALTKLGGGALTLGPTCSAGHIGSTAVNAGSLVVNGAITVSPVIVGNGGTLAGGGSIQPAVAILSGGAISPGDGSVGTLTFGAELTLAAGSTYVADITGPAAHDRLLITGTLSAGGVVKPVLAGYAPVAGDSFDLADAAIFVDAPTFDFSSATLGAGLTWDTSSFLTDGAIKVIADGGAYDSWAAAKGLTAANNAKNADPDGDGILNALEFYLDADPLAGGGPGFSASASGANARIAYKRRDDAEDLSVVAESSDTLAAGSWSPLVNGVDGVVITITENGPDPDDIEILLPTAPGRRFARLKLPLP
jgi:hypothetical protein